MMHFILTFTLGKKKILEKMLINMISQTIYFYSHCKHFAKYNKNKHYGIKIKHVFTLHSQDRKTYQQILYAKAAKWNINLVFTNVQRI